MPTILSYILTTLLTIICVVSVCLIVLRSSLLLSRSSSTRHSDVEHPYDTSNRASLHVFPSPALDLPDFPHPKPVVVEDDCRPAAKRLCTVGDKSSYAMCKDANVTCRHLTRDLRYTDKIVLPANTALDQGYVLPPLGALESFACNPYTGDLVLVQADDGAHTTVDAPYRLMCSCKRPDLIGKSKPFGDCDTVHMCNGRVTSLDEPIQKMNCVITDRLREQQVRDSENVPHVVPKPLSDFTREDYAEAAPHHANKTMPVDKLHSQAVSAFKRTTDWLPDTCRVSLFAGDNRATTRGVYDPLLGGCKALGSAIPYTLDHGQTTETTHNSMFADDGHGADGILDADFEVIRLTGGWQKHNGLMRVGYVLPRNNLPAFMRLRHLPYQLAFRGLTTVGKYGGLKPAVDNQTVDTVVCDANDKCTSKKGPRRTYADSHLGFKYYGASSMDKIACYQKSGACRYLRGYHDMSFMQIEGKPGLIRFNRTTFDLWHNAVYGLQLDKANEKVKFLYYASEAERNQDDENVSHVTESEMEEYIHRGPTYR